MERISGGKLMKTAINLISKKSLIKATSGILSFVLTVNTCLNLVYENVSARDIKYDYDGTTDSITLSANNGESEIFYLVKDGDNFYIDDSPENTEHEKNLPRMANINVSSNCTLVVKTTYDCPEIYLNGGTEEGTEAVLLVDTDGIFVHYNVIKGSGLNKILNYGEFRGEIFNTSQMESDGIKEFRNEGLVDGRTIIIDSDIYSDISGTTVSAIDSFTKDDRDLNAAVKVASSATITSTGGSFKYLVNSTTGSTIEVTEPVDGLSPSELIKDPEITLDTIPNIYVGEDHDFSTYIHTASDYTGTPYLEFSDLGETWTTEEPIFDSTGEYYVRAVAPSSGRYKESYTAAQLYNVTFLDPTDKDINDGEYYTFDNVVNGNYINEKAKVVPADGYLISFNGEDFADYAMVAKDDVIDPYDNYYSHVYFRLKRIEDNAVTAQISPIENTAVDFRDYIFDSSDPVWFGLVYDSEHDGAQEIDLRQEVICGDKLEISIRDDNFDSIIVKVDKTETDVVDTVVEDQCDLTFNSIEGKAQHIKITATDKAGRSNGVEFDFYPERIESTISLSAPETIYAGDDYEITVETNSDATPQFKYYYTDRNTDIVGQPKTAGNYFVVVTLEETNLYTANEATTEFSIIKRTPAITFNVPSIYVGDEVSPILTTDSDGKDDATYEYKVKGADDSTYSSTVPTAAGEYTARVTVPETPNYDEQTATANFKIEKKQIAATVTVENSYVGEEYSVDIQVTSADYEGNTDESTIEYKLSTDEDEAYSEEVPEAAGEYTVRVTLPETDSYLETVIESTFTIYKQEYLGSISAADIYVGDSVNVSIYNTLMDRDDLIYEYKLVTEPDSAFSTVEPQAAGTYRVRVTAPENYYFETTTFTKDFTISKRPITATVFVDDLEAGDDIVPIISTDPEGYDGTEITYEYKRSDVADAVFSTTVPTAAGNYIIQATLPETDAYLGTTCTATFQISRISVGAEVDFRGRLYYGDTPDPIVTTDPAGYDGTVTFQYKLSTEPDSSYSDTVPVNAGNYIVRATLSETDTYYGTTCTAEFPIYKYSIYPEVEIDDLYYGETVNPFLMEVRSDYDGVVTYEYKLQTDPDTAYSTIVPTVPGDYVCRVTVPDTDNFWGGICSCNFTIFKADTIADVYVDDIYVGEEIVPELDIDPSGYDGTPVYEYKSSAAANTAYSTTVPTAAGEYTVRATIPETETYEGATCTDTFTIKKYELTATVTVNDITYGGTITPVVEYECTGTYTGSTATTYAYKKAGEDDSAYSATKPTAPGTYVCRATLPETNNCLGTTCSTEFNISMLEGTATVTISDIFVGETPDPVVTTNSTNGDNTVFEYKLSTAADTAYSTTVPSAAGTYTVRATVPATNIYTSATATATFTISKIEASATVTVSNIYVGQNPVPVVGTNSDGKDDTAFEYKLSTAEDTAYTATVPTAAGTYTVRATVPATFAYTSASATATFTISKIPCSVTVTANEINAGEEPDLDIETNSDALDQAIYEYREYSEPDTAFAEGYPTEAGLYVIRVTIPETDKYLSGSGTCEMQVNRNDVIATISVADIYVGETPDPVITSDSPAKNDATIEYKLASAPDTAYSTTVPTAAGTYSVRASLPFTVFYKATTCETTFTISKRDVSASVSVADIVYGGTVNPVITINSEDYEAKDQVTYLYAPHDIENPAEFTGDIPTEVGEYSVMAVLPETDTYYGTEVFAIFNINRQPLDATVSVEDVFYGEEFTVKFTIQGSKYFLTHEYYYFEYKPADAADSAYTTTRPTATGNYVVRLTVLPNSYTEDGVATGTFAIKKLSPTATVSVADIYVGGTVTPEVTTVSDGKDDTMFEYKLSTAADTAYVTTVPTAAGTYTVRATVPATLINNSVTATATFTISKNPATASVTVADITVGNNPAPVVTTASDGVATYEYKVAGADDSTYSDTIPTAAGTYTVKATVPETAKYLATTATANFEIIKNETTATVSVANITVGNDPEPIVSTVSDGKYLATFQYKAAGADDSAYADTVPTAAGTYTVKASIPETAKYFALTATADFTISKNVATSEVTVDDILVGGTISPVITTNSDGAKTVEYKAADADDSAYSTTLPYVEGRYSVRVTISETAKYLATSCTSDFFISKSEVGASVSVENIYVGGEVVPVISTESNGKEDTVFEYKVAGADDSTYTYTVPSAAGTYTVRATVPATLEYTSIVCYDSFEIYLNPVTMQKFKVENFFVGQSPDPEFECSSNGDVTFEYKSKNADDSEYTTDEPTKAGIYTIRATVEETAVYASASFITDFTISYLNAPQTAFTPAGTEGKNGYFKSDVELTAPAGYKISATENGEYTDKIPYTDDLNTIYLKRDDGAKTSAITITDKPKIDKAAPTFNFSTGTVAEDSVMFIPSLVITVDDPNLKSLTLNGQSVDLTAVSGNVITLSPGWGTLEVTVVAEDIAGNISKISFILKAEWLELGTIPADQLVPLEIKTEYNLGDGKWQVIKGNPDDNSVKTEADPTVYNGGMPVYAAEGGEYTVTQVS